MYAYIYTHIYTYTRNVYHIEIFMHVYICIHILTGNTVDGGNLAPLEYKLFQVSPHPLLNIVRECRVLGVWSNDINVAAPHLATAQC